MTKFVFITLILSVLLSSMSVAQHSKKKDRQTIKKMCGCYKVSFNFAETFHYSNDSSYQPSQTKHDWALERVELIEETKNKLVLQHLLVITQKDKPPFVMKHWRQDWIYQNQDMYYYDVDQKWKYVKLPKDAVKGEWTQKVFQVDDSPRYEGSAPWIHRDGKHFWENTTDAPLPRREKTIRKDYNVTIRGNRHEITPRGWVHDQDNKKVVRKTGKKDIILAEEKGFNTYQRVEDSKCKDAQKWWKKNQYKWSIVRQKWDVIFAQKKAIKLRKSVDKKPLFRYLFRDDIKDQEIGEIIQSFVIQ